MILPWFIPVALAIILLLLLFALQKSQSSFWRSRSKRYRLRYLQLIHRAEDIALMLNDWAPLVVNLNAKSDTNKTILKLFESLMHQFENLLLIFKDLKPFGDDLYQVNWGHYLLKDCRAKVVGFQKQLDLHFQGRRKEIFSRPPGKISQQIPFGCYFCSKPFTYGGLTRVKVRLEGDIRSVFSCAGCKNVLETDKRVKILFFLVNGKSKHWSEVEDYNPVRDYWNINEKTSVRQTVKLELITTQDLNKE